jgi:hypothetical protein
MGNAWPAIVAITATLALGSAGGQATRLPGTGAKTAVLSVSCSAAGDCTVGGTGFVDSESSGHWGTARPVPGTSGLGVQWSVACGAPGHCAAAGNHSGAVYLASEDDGRWSTAEKVPGLAALNRGGNAAINALSCGAAGSCSAGGSYVDGSGHTQAFVVSQAGGTWRAAQEVPGLAALNKGGYASLSALSCASAGHCTGGGLYTDASGGQQAFVVTQGGSGWAAATALPGLVSLNKGKYAQVSAISCPSATDCAAGGIYTDGGYNNTAFVVSEKSGTWQKPLRLAGINGLSPGPSVGIDQISCSSPGDCGAGGFYTDANGSQQAFVAGESNGRWSSGLAVPGTVKPNTGRSALTASVSCRAPGRCLAGGLYTLVSGHSVVFVVSEVNGVWSQATTVGGIGDYESLYAVSCAAPASCVSGLGARPDSPGDSYVLTG